MRTLGIMKKVIKIEPNVFNDGSVDSIKVDQLRPEDLCHSNSDRSDTLRKIIINKVTYDEKGSSSQKNYLFNAIKLSNVAMNVGVSHHMLKRFNVITIDVIRMFVSECYELNQGDTLYSKVMASFLGYESPNGVKFNQSVELIQLMKQDGNWMHADFYAYPLFHCNCMLIS